MSRPSTSTILIADDDPQFLAVMEHHLRSWSYRVESALDKSQLLRKLAVGLPDLLLMDVRFGEHDGVEILRQLKVQYPQIKTAMLTAYGSIDNAITAIRLGAVDYLTKPVDLNRLRSVVSLALEPSESKTSAPQTSDAGRMPPLSRPLLGDSRAMHGLRRLVERVASTDATVLILGESGTGKELVARALHELSPRRKAPFIALNVAALPRELIESTLFGHAKGAFTGADQMQVGCVEAANGGTLFLDEIGEMEVGLQSKLLRFLQERSFQRVGQSSLVNVDVRVLAATNRDLLDQVRRGQFRQDLFYRLNVIPVNLPPLRERRDDIPLLAMHFLDRSPSACGIPSQRFTDDALSELKNHDWPGNVRELENFVLRLAILGREPIISADHVREELRTLNPAPQAAFDRLPPFGPLPESGTDHLRPIDRIEHDAIVQALASTNGNVREAAKRLGLGQATVYRKIKKYGIS